MSENGESSMSKKNKISLRISDGELFDLDEEVAMGFVKIKNYFVDDEASYDTVVPLPNVTSGSLVKVVEYCKKHIELRSKSTGDDKEIKAFDEEFVKGENKGTLIELIESTEECLGFQVKYRV